MIKIYLWLAVLFITIGGMQLPAHSDVLAIGREFATDTSKLITATISTKITDTRLTKPAFLKNGVMVNFVPFKPAKDKTYAGTPPSRPMKAGDNDKVLNNVIVYPNPVSGQLNLSYSLSKDATVTVRIMDVLGNEITRLLNERLAAGEQKNSFNIASRLSSGFYFIRVSIAGEIITKRISVL